jgi:hypothetical protein
MTLFYKIKLQFILFFKRTVSFGSNMFAVGHLALGYISGKGAARFLNASVNVPLIFLASILPDIDFLVPGLMHCGPVHSIIRYALVFIPIIILYKKIGIIYFLCAAQHLLFAFLDCWLRRRHTAFVASNFKLAQCRDLPSKRCQRILGMDFFCHMLSVDV